MPTADWVLVSGRVESMSPIATEATSLAIADGKVLAVGTNEQIERFVGRRTVSTDLHGATVLPGFIDTHMHLQKIAREFAMVHLEAARSIADIVSRVARAAALADLDEWIQSFGDDNAWHEDQLDERRPPTCAELDGAAPDHLVFLYRGPDLAVLNSRAAAVLQLEDAGLQPPVWDAATGLLCGPAARAVQADLSPPMPAQELKLLNSGGKRLLRMGITGVVDPGLPARFEETWDLYREAKSKDVLPQRIWLMNRLDYRLRFDAELQRVAAGSVTPGTREGDLEAFAVKLILDGEFDNAWVRRNEAPRVKPVRRYARNELDAAVGLCAARRWPLCVHAVGGGATDEVLDAVASAARRKATFERDQVSLAHVFFPSHENLLACRRLGVALSVQPLLAYVFEHEMQAAWDVLADQSNPLRTILESGITLAGGSDVLPCEPLLSILTAFTRRSRHGTVFGAAESITVAEALRLFTSSAGMYVRRQDLGVLVPGATADFVVWPKNPLDIDPKSLLSLTPTLVAIAGRAIADF